MSDHSRALVPVASWAYASPAVRAAGHQIDLGVLAEALIYYDQVLINVNTQPHFGELLEWASSRQQLGLLRSLIYDGIVEIYEYSFASAPVHMAHENTHRLLNIQDQLQSQPNSFGRRFFTHASVVSAVPTVPQLRQLEAALGGRIIEAKGDDFGITIQEAMRDLNDPFRASLLVQRFVDDLYEFRGLGPAPIITASVARTGEARHRVTWNINFGELDQLAGDSVSFTASTPGSAATATTRLLWSASRLECDLMLPSPLSSVLGDKLSESSLHTASPRATVSNLKAFAQFPDVASLVNTGHLSLKDVLAIRKKARRFRRWLQQPGDRDIDALVAYHSEVARISGLERASRRSVSLFGMLGGAAIGLNVDGVFGAGLASATAYVADVASKLASSWRPIVFGRWLDSRLHDLADRRDAG